MRFGGRLIDTLDQLMRRQDLDGAFRAGLLRFAGHMGEPNLGAAIKRLLVGRYDARGDQLEGRWLLDRQIRRLSALEDPSGVNAELAINRREARSIANPPAELGELAFTYVVARIVPAPTALISREWTKGSLTGAQLMRSMKFPPSLKPGIWGVVIGAAAISVLGFTIFGWALGGPAERMAKERAQTAVVDVLAPICVERFHQQAECAGEIDGVQQGLVMGPTVDHRDGRLGNSAGNRYS
jgi:hypothetical protein